MAHGETIFRHPTTNATRVAPIGFSWTMLFFGSFVPALRSDWKHAVISLAAAIVTGGLSWFAYPFFYNGMYTKDLVNNGFVVVESLHPPGDRPNVPPGQEPAFDSDKIEPTF